MSKLALGGVKVLDVSTVIAGPFGAVLLADFGADVIKVEMPGKGDSLRGLGPFFQGEPLRWPALARNKKSLTLDLHKARGIELFKQLATKVDVIIESFRPGTLEKWGIGYETLKSLNPDVIMVRVSGYGQTGPYREKAGFGTPATAFGGYTYLQGFRDRYPVSPSFSLADYVTGIYVAFAAVTALYYRDQSGRGSGQMVDIALYESLFRMMEFLVAEFDQQGRVRERSPGLSGHSSPVGTFLTKDEHYVVMVTSTDSTFERLAKAMGREDMLSDQRFSSNAKRLENTEETNEIVSDWIGTMNRDELLRILDDCGVPVSPILSIKDIFENPQYQARESIIEVQHPRLGSIKMPGFIPKFEKTPGSIRNIAPDLGEHTYEILRDVLGLSDLEIRELRLNEVI